MPGGQHIYCIVGRLVAIQRDVAGIPKRYYKFAQLRHIKKGAAYVRRLL